MSGIYGNQVVLGVLRDITEYAGLAEDAEERLHTTLYGTIRIFNQTSHPMSRPGRFCDLKFVERSLSW